MNDRVVLTVPTRGEFARTVRVAAGELASRAGMCIDDVEDVKLAAEECFVLACGLENASEVSFVFDLTDGGMEIEVGPLPGECVRWNDGQSGERYARFILESVCDECAPAERDGTCVLRLVKRMA